MAPSESFDYIIVGAGSAGCTLAHRLTEDRDVSVLVLEAGGWDRDPWIHIPLGWPRLLINRMHDWMYFAEPEETMGGRGLECARGKVVGGSSSINAMAYVRGHRGDYERWAGAVSPDWGYASVLPYFRRMESWVGGADAYRGSDGPLSVDICRYRDPLTEAFAAAGRSAGHPATDDYNGASQEGFGTWQTTIRDGRRCSTAVAYLRPALARPNLTVRTGALATRVVLEGERASGIEYERHGQLKVARAEREVILSGGVINSPQLLMLSGIGDPDHLRSHGIAPRIALKGVGRNLQDHISAHVAWLRRESGPFHKAMRADRIAFELANCYLRGRGIATDLPGGEMAFLRSPEAGAGGLPDIQLLFNAAPMTAMPYLAPFVAPYPDGFACRAAVLRPESRGELTLKSADPRQPMRIKQSFLAADADRRALRAGLRLVREIGAQKELAGFIAKEVGPGPQGWSDAGLDEHVKAVGITVHHPACTCRMGKAGDPDAVVDPELRVIGARGLRVVDAAVMPDLVGGNINAPVIMIAEKASDMIRGRPAPAPAEAALARSRPPH